MMKYIVLLE